MPLYRENCSRRDDRIFENATGLRGTPSAALGLPCLVVLASYAVLLAIIQAGFVRYKRFNLIKIDEPKRNPRADATL